MLARALAFVFFALSMTVSPNASAQSDDAIPDGYGRLVVVADHDDTAVEINGVAYPYEWLYGDLQGVFIPADRRLNIVVSSGEDHRRTFRFSLDNGETRVLVVDIAGAGAAPPQRPTREREMREEEEAEEDTPTGGFLGVSSSPRGVVFVDGRETEQRTPARRIELEPGRHEVQVYYDEEDVMSEVKHVLIRAGVNTNVFFRLRREQLEEEE